ncbi:hypothetical protein P4I29_24385, partial [Escherichia coli]|uniref:hypothetical protein n=2 Tax=Escherichia coli TaxID=562 RepID=UPI003CEBDB16
KTSIFSHPVYLFLRKFSLQDSRGGSLHTSLVTNQGSPSIMNIRIWQDDSKEKMEGLVFMAITFVVRLITTAETNQMVVNCAELVLPATKEPGAPFGAPTQPTIE